MKFGICGGPGTNILVDIKGQLEAERTPCLKGGGQEELPHVQEPWLRRAEEGLEELSHVEGQEGRR